MFVKILILIITITLIANEFYHFLDKLSSKIRKIILFSIIGLLTLLSLIDIYNDEQEANQLKEKADAIFTKAEEINKLQNENNQNIAESRKEIENVDSVSKVVERTVKNQVKLLNQAVVKSEDLLKIEKAKFNLERPRLSVISTGVTFTDFFKNESKMAFEIEARNRGKRRATNVSFGYTLVAFKNGTSLKNIFFGDYGMDKIKDFDEKTKLLLKKKFRISKEEFDNQYGSGILVCRFIYTDEIGGIEYDENNFIGLRIVENVGSVFHTITDENQEERAIKYLNELKLFDYLSKENITGN